PNSLSVAHRRHFLLKRQSHPSGSVVEKGNAFFYNIFVLKDPRMAQSAGLIKTGLRIALNQSKGMRQRNLPVVGVVNQQQVDRLRQMFNKMQGGKRFERLPGGSENVILEITPRFRRSVDCREISIDNLIADGG